MTGERTLRQESPGGRCGWGQVEGAGRGGAAGEEMTGSGDSGCQGGLQRGGSLWLLRGAGDRLPCREGRSRTRSEAAMKTPRLVAATGVVSGWILDLF